MKCYLCNEEAKHQLVDYDLCDLHFDEVVKYSNIINLAMEEEGEEDESK